MTSQLDYSGMTSTEQRDAVEDADRLPVAPGEPGTETQKKGSLFGGALSEDVLASSRKVLSRTYGNGALTGLQQWFTPLPAAQLISEVFGAADAVLDPTAGSGSLLCPYPEERRFGVEIDGDHTEDAAYNAITADIQAVVPMMRATGLRFPAIATNPPFGLSWRDPLYTKGEINSTALTYLWTIDLLSANGQGAMICGTDRLRKEVLSRPQGAGVYAIVDIEGEFFAGVTLPVSIAFFVKPENRKSNTGPVPGRVHSEVLSATKEDLPYIGSEIVSARSRSTQHVSHLDDLSRQERMKMFNAVAREQAERAKEAKTLRERNRYDVAVKGNKVSVGLAAYAELALARQKILTDIKLLNGQHVSYFGQNTRDWKKVAEARDAGYLRVDPALEARVEKALEDAELVSTPLFPVKPAMRLGWLTDLDRITCTKDDPEKGFEAGQEYPLYTSSKIHTEKESRVVEKKTGEPELRHFETERKLLSIDINQKTFDESNENIEYLVSHFDFPDPGCVATRYPDLMRDRRHLLKAISKKNGFKYRTFQLEHYPRLLIKQRGMIAHEQGLGKTLGLMTMLEATIWLGAENRGLVCVPQDLIPQWNRESKKFFNRRIEVISNPIEARRVAERIKNGETGWWLTYFEAMSIVGRKHEMLPVDSFDPKVCLKHRLYLYKQAKKSGTLDDLRADQEENRLDPARLPALPSGIQDEAQDEAQLFPSFFDLAKKAPATARAKNTKPKPAKTKKEKQNWPVPADPYAAYGVDAPEEESVGDLDYTAAKALLEQSLSDATLVACPKCGASTYAGWDGEVCHAPKRCVTHRRGECPKDRVGCVVKGCGYTHRSLLVKPAYSHLTRVFKKGVKCVDEVSEIRGDDSLRSKAIRGISAGPHNYGATGTPLSNFVGDSFNGLAFSLGYGSVAFPYSYDGKGKFESDFAVIEYMKGREEDDEEHLRKRRKVLPRITNVSQFWRLAQPGVSRCRKEHTGEPIVQRTYHPIRVPMGKKQHASNAFWLENFSDYFRWRYPDHYMSVEGLVDKWAAALGQLWHLERAATLPASCQPSREWPRAQAVLGELSNWTPANLKVLQLAMEHASRGEKVLIGSDLVLTGKWIADRLCEKGIRAVHITEEKGSGDDLVVGTKNPRRRAREIQEFVEGDAQVLCAGVGAMKLGHNLDVASTVIVSGLPWSFMVWDQFIARVHRLTSKRDVSIYAVIPRNSLSERKWSLLKDKGGTSDLAFDGELSIQPEKPVDWAKILREMKRQGIKPNGDEVPEEEIEAAWRELAPVVSIPTGNTSHPIGHNKRTSQPSLDNSDLLLASGDDYVQPSLL